MGGLISRAVKIVTKRKKFEINESIPGQDTSAYKSLKRLFLEDNEIDLFFKAYCEIDADNSGSIRDDEFRAFFRMEKNPFNQKLFSMFDSDNSGFLNFFEFTCSVRFALNVAIFLTSRLLCSFGIFCPLMGLN